MKEYQEKPEGWIDDIDKAREIAKNSHSIRSAAVNLRKQAKLYEVRAKEADKSADSNEKADEIRFDIMKSLEKKSVEEIEELTKEFLNKIGDVEQDEWTSEQSIEYSGYWNALSRAKIKREFNISD